MRSRSSLFLAFAFLFCIGFAFAFSKKNTFYNPTAKTRVAPPGPVQPGQTKDYDKLWKRVDSLQNKGLYASALEQCDKILKKASDENNAPQVVKSVVYKIKFNSYIKEEDYVSAIAELEKISGAAQHPLKQIIHSVTAEVYYGYYQRNRWRFYNRSTTVDFKNEDISTWDLKTLSQKVLLEYLQSMSDADKSKVLAIDNFEDILLNMETDGKRLRPTLYDFLAWRAYGFFAGNEFDVTRPAEKFTLNDNAYLQPRNIFLQQKIQSVDSFSTKLYATGLIADLLRFHAADQDPYPLVHCDLERLDFVRRNSVSPEKDSIYFETLKQLANEFSTHEAWSEIQYHVALYTTVQAARYNPQLGDKHKGDYKTALQLCNQAIEKFPKSYGARLAESLKSTINEKDISFTTEDVVMPNLPTIALVQSRNVKKAWFRVINVGWDFSRGDDYYEEEKFVKRLLAYKPVKTFDLDLQDDGDYHRHSLDFALQGMAPGMYYILSSASPEFKTTANAIGYNTHIVSDIGYIDSRVNSGNDYTFYVLSRNTGKPLAGAKFTIVYNDYDSRAYKYKRTRGKTYTADTEGKVILDEPLKDYRYFYVDIVYNTDHFVSNRQHYQYKPYKSTPYERINTYFFTDRKIYRPGQTIYFKGIQVRSLDGNNPTLVTNSRVNVELRDVNNQKVSNLDLTTNEYGSYSGSFTAPQGVLTGNMYITDGHGTHYFSVEEYKRPKFEVEFNPVEGTYRLNDSIKAQGFAKSFNGAMVDGAEVKYRVVRNVNYWRWNWWWGPQPYYAPTEIASGTTVTDEKGEFKVSFKAMPDKATDPKRKPVFNYTVYADITDLNGETRSATQSINAGYHTMIINIGVQDELDKNGSEVIRLGTTNLNYNKVPATGKFRISKLINPDNLTVDRKTGIADRHALSYEAFKAQFPYELYGDENNYEKWKRSRILFQTDFNTEKSDSIILAGLKNWEPGIYVAEAFSKDKWEQEVKETVYFKIYDKGATKLPVPEPFYLKSLKSPVEPGEQAQFLIGTAYPDVHAIVEWESKDGVIKKEIVSLNNEQKIVSFPIEEKHRGNITFSVNFLRNNRYYAAKEYVIVPFTNKQLDITFETFRNKLYPGQDEEWKINIKGKKGDKVAAELLMTMYDASLDEFAPNAYYMNVYNSMYSSRYWESSEGFGARSSQLFQNGFNNYVSTPYRYMYSLNWFGFQPTYNSYGYYGDLESGRGREMYRAGNKASVNMDYAVAEESESDQLAPPPPPAPTTTLSKNDEQKNTRKEVTRNVPGDVTDGVLMSQADEDTRAGLGNVKARTNLGETAFFFPNLETNENGDVVVKFKMPESLTKWKILGLGHTKDLRTGTTVNNLITQKDLMIVPNMPRFLREGDKINLVTKITNISETDLSGNTQLILLDAFTGKPLGSEFQLKDDVQAFAVKAKQSTQAGWDITVPFGVEAVTWRVVAKAKNFTDGEEAALPVLSNRMLVTESMPLHIRKKGSKTFSFNKLLSSGSSKTLKNYKLTLEYCSNPAWYGIQSLPYLMEYPYECAEQTFSRFYANSIAHNIANSNPKIKAVFDAWKNTSPESFLSNLEKNQELKSVVLEETPWVLEAKSESERKKRVGLLFDFNKMADELDRAIKKLEKMQAGNGGWPWFPGMPESRYITQHIVTGMGHLDKLGVKKIREEQRVWNMVKKGVDYLDHEFLRDYRDLKRYNKNYLKDQTISYYQVQYLYARSYFKDLPVKGELKEAVDYYIKQEQKYWLQFNLYAEAMIALTLNRYDDAKTTTDIIKSLKERSLYSEEMGRYWKENTVGYYWYEAPIETQAMMIECFDEAGKDETTVEDLKVWLLKNKQTNAWQTTKATTEACYALLLRGSDWLANDEQVEIEMGGKKIDAKEMGAKTEAGTGYFKVNWNGEEIKPQMGNIKLTTNTNSVSWGALHWQYFEDLDKITGHETPIQLKKELFTVENTSSGPVIKPISAKNKLKIGDKVRVRIELRIDRQMEFVHMKDMRASGFEPLNVFSRYKYQDGLGYYESTRDAATHFFFDNIGKGTYVFEYDLRVQHAGDFSNGIAQIQCMYAPEFNSHSAGIRVDVAKGK